MQCTASASIGTTSNERNEIIPVSHQRLSVFDSTSLRDRDHSGPIEYQTERVKCSQQR